MQSILARTHLIYNDKDVVRSLNKLLSYNPINEFEPFLRVSLRSSGAPSVLPLHLIYLGGDGMLRENFHVLCNHGIPRSKIQKEAYENLSSSKTTVVKLASCCPPLLVATAEQLLDLLKRNPVSVFEGTGKKVYALFGRLLKLGFKLRVKNLLRSILIFCFCKWSSCSTPLKGPRTLCKQFKFKKDSLYHFHEEEAPKAAKKLASRGPNNKLEKTAFLMRFGCVENSDEITRVLDKKIDCLTNFLGYSKYTWLREKGAAKPRVSSAKILACSDVQFGPAIWESLRNASVQAKASPALKQCTDPEEFFVPKDNNITSLLFHFFTIRWYRRQGSQKRPTLRSQNEKRSCSQSTLQPIFSSSLSSDLCRYALSHPPIISII
ncbi:hypothetical protein SADUNF_Sadunf15G0100700 [Salix dunnii]|uniref:Uncharacterized protein n=1 Tax=Salix dunnii TaxID=1413687 RepID=A0A835MJJ5_9ROSI|nr:hypothetical protein SADUNF_Sadunf15G0100700 [Salix dunnii]